MTKLERLEDIACKRGINIHNFSISKTKKAGCYHEVDGNFEYKAILMDKPKIKGKTEETALLAEEVGHFETNALYMIDATINTPTARSNRQKYEVQAKRWGVKYLVPKKQIQRAFDDGRIMDYEIAEFCDVDVDTFRKAMEIYQQENVKFDYPHDEDVI